MAAALAREASAAGETSVSLVLGTTASPWVPPVGGAFAR